MAPFRGLRFDATVVGDLGSVISPPYDVLDADIVRDLEAGNQPQHRPADSVTQAPASLPRGASPAGEVARPGLPGARPGTGPLPVPVHRRRSVAVRGVMGLVGLREEHERVVLPHEDVMPDPVEDRAVLMRTTGTNLEPILLVHQGTTTARRAARGGHPYATGRGLHRPRRQPAPAVDAHRRRDPRRRSRRSSLPGRRSSPTGITGTPPTSASSARCVTRRPRSGSPRGTTASPCSSTRTTTPSRSGRSTGRWPVSPCRTCSSCAHERGDTVEDMHRPRVRSGRAVRRGRRPCRLRALRRPVLGCAGAPIGSTTSTRRCCTASCSRPGT